MNSIVGLKLGDEEAGILYIQDTGVKKLNYTYIDKNNNKLYKCKQETSSVSNTSEYFEESNINGLPRLRVVEIEVPKNEVVYAPEDISWIFGIACIKDYSDGYYWSSHVVINHYENHILRRLYEYQGPETKEQVDYLHLRINLGSIRILRGKYEDGVGQELEGGPILKNHYLYKMKYFYYD